MEIISTSNLVSSETEKLTTAFDSSFHNARTVKKQWKSYKQKIKTDQQEGKRKSFIFFKIPLSVANNRTTAIERWSSISCQTTINPGEKLVGERRVGEGTLEEFSY